MTRIKMVKNWFDETDLERRARQARVNASNNLRKIGFDNTNYSILSKYLRNYTAFDIMTDMNEEDVKKLELLNGPYTLVILKVGLIRNGEI